MGFFPKGLTHDFGQKLKISYFDQDRPRNIVFLHQVKKQVFLDYKILINKVATLDFIKGVNPRTARVSKSVSQQVTQPVSEPVGQLVSYSVIQSASHSASQSVN